MQAISATELARNTRAVLDSVLTRGETITVERNHVTIARILPPEQAHPLASQSLANLHPTLRPEQAAAWLDARREALDETVSDPWA